MDLSLEFFIPTPKRQIQIVVAGQGSRALSQPQTTTLAATNLIRGPEGSTGTVDLSSLPPLP